MAAAATKTKKPTSEQVSTWPPVQTNVHPDKLKDMDHAAVDEGETRAEFIRVAIDERLERLKKK